MSKNPIISLHYVDIYRQNNLILKDINLEIQPGEFVFIIGRVGSGKSSLLKFLNAELETRRGNVIVAGYDINNIKEKEIPKLRRKIGVVHQDFRLLTDRTVHENLIFALLATGWTNKEDIENRINEVLELVKMEHKKNSMPHELSGGEQQRIVIARAVLNNPDIIFADEPTGNLDPQTSRELMEIFRELNEQGITILMATHDYQLIDKNESRIIHVEEQLIFDPKSKII